MKFDLCVTGFGAVERFFTGMSSYVNVKISDNSARTRATAVSASSIRQRGGDIGAH